MLQSNLELGPSNIVVSEKNAKQNKEGTMLQLSLNFMGSFCSLSRHISLLTTILNIIARTEHYCRCGLPGVGWEVGAAESGF